MSPSSSLELTLAEARRRLVLLEKEQARSRADAVSKRALRELASALDLLETALRQRADTSDRVERIRAELDVQQERMTHLLRDVVGEFSV